MNILSYILCFLWAFLISLFAIPSIRSMALKKRLLDEPNGRSMHEISTPRLGGMAIFAGLLSALTLFGTVTPSIQCMLSGAILIFFIGLKDDILPVSPVKKFFIQVLATSILLFIGNIRITSFQGFLGIGVINEGISYFFSAIVIIGITNSINLIDGLDGLAGSVIVLISSCFGISFFISQNSPLLGLSICLIGGTIGFLRYNFEKANIFMGDSGSLVLGFIIAFLSINFLEMQIFNANIALIIAFLYIPILDTSRVFGLRILSGTSPFVPDKNHLHHVLSNKGLNSIATKAVLILFNLSIVLFVASYQDLGNTLLVSIEIILGLLVVVALKFIEK
ncbi:MAG: MraY family glycosyltransferase [Cytophagales bacterium]